MINNSKTIPVGYKQSEIGMLPEDWEVDLVKNIATISTGKKNTQDRIPDGKYPFFVRSQTIERINSYSYDGEAVLTAGDGVGTGKVFHYINGKFDIHQRVYKISAFSKHISGYFFFLYFSNNFYNRIMQMTAKSSVDSVRMEMIADMQLPLPPLPEQTAIATALSDTDTLIEKLETLIQKKKNIKQGAMQELLTGKRRLEGFSGEWECKTIGDITEVIGGGTPSTSVLDYWNGNINWFTPTEIGVKKYAYESIRKITENGLKNSSARILLEGTILLTSRAGIGSLAILKNKACTNQGFQSLSPTRGTDCEFLYYLMLTKTKSLLEKASGSTFLEISPSNLKSVEITIPPTKDEQTAIATILSDMDTEIQQLESQLAKYQAIKQGMMQVLLTGKIRLTT